MNNDLMKEIIEAVNHTIFGYLSGHETLSRDKALQEMLFYALGFDNNGGLLSGGKRLRPLFCCLSCGLMSGSYREALLYGAGLEMLHNFTLIHDDIEDNGDVRHKRPALWKRDGLALALNAGDMLYNIAMEAEAEADRSSGLTGFRCVLTMAGHLFMGQHRDISFENRTDITEYEYLQMVRGKTSALLGCAFALGAMAGGADEKTIEDFEYAGQRLGIAFQIRDDYLGTWGDSDVFGKSVSGDIMEKKNTLAVVYTAERDPVFRSLWAGYDGSAERVREFSGMMEKAGAPQYLQEQCAKYTNEAQDILSAYRSGNEYQSLLDKIIVSLVDRNI